MGGALGICAVAYLFSRTFVGCGADCAYNTDKYNISPPLYTHTHPAPHTLAHKAKQNKTKNVSDKDPVKRGR